MDMIKFSEEVYANAVAHGWHESVRPDAEYIAMICSEWCEALADWRSGGAVYETRDGKPEGVVVELADGVIRILDYLAENGCEPYNTLDDYKVGNLPEPYGVHLGKDSKRTFPEQIGLLCTYTAKGCNDYGYMDAAISLALEMVCKAGADPEDVLIAKHEYNLTRPYRHGGKRC